MKCTIHDKLTEEFVWEIKLRINTRLNTLGRFLNKEHRAVMLGIVPSFQEVSALFLWFWIYLLSQPVESTHTGIPKLHLSIPATLNTPRVTEGAFWIYLLSQPVESTHTGIPKLHLSIPATLNTPRVTEGAFGHLLNRALANIALPNSRIDKCPKATLGPIDTCVLTRNTNIEDFVTRS